MLKDDTCVLVIPEPLPPEYVPSWNERCNRFVVMDRSAKMPMSCWTGKGQYRRVGVVELTWQARRSGQEPKMLSSRARGVRRVVETWERVYKGSTIKCAHHRALVEAENLAEKLNAVEFYIQP